MASAQTKNSLSLRKSCEACAKAKRRCDRQCPCFQCRVNGKVCSYRNLPWHLGAVIDGLANFDATSRRAGQVSQRRLHLTAGSSPLRQPSSPVIWRNLEATDLELIKASLRQIPPACTCKIETNDPISGLLDLLKATQSLLLVQVNSIFNTYNRIRRQQQMLKQFGHRLWKEAPASLPNTMTAHEAWKIGESIRRTIIATHLLTILVCAIESNVVQYQPFLVSLPFDRRIALWTMDENEPMLMHIDAKATPLVSMREWLDGDESSHVAAASVLQRILLILYRPWSHRVLPVLYN